MLFSLALPSGKAEPELIAQCGTAFREAYGQRWNRQTRPYPGITQLLDALEARQIRLAVLSNKPDRFTKLCVGEYFPGRPFEAVLGQREGVPRKPDPQAAHEIARLMKIAPEEFVYLGDTPTDVQTARNAGMLPVGVTWGFRPAEELTAAGATTVIERPIELVDVL
jgi:phosphoglycolate phosphatase